MTLLDTNVLIDAQNKDSLFWRWANAVIEQSIAAGSVGINVVVLAELSAAEHARVEDIEAELRSAEIQIFDLPVAAAGICGRAYRQYRRARKKSGGGESPGVPLPDFFIGAHAELMNWKVATRDPERFQLYFSNVDLVQPPRK